MICGLQKLTLLDYPGRIACTVFTGGCNLRCPFCHNASLVLPGRERGEVSREELISFLKKRRGLLGGVAVTGGEPLLHPELPELLREIRSLGYDVKLDTNGTFPERLRSVIDEGLVSRVAMDVKSSPAGYAAATGIAGIDLSPVRESVRLLLEGRVEYEFRTTFVKGLHTKKDAEGIGRWLSGAREYYLQDFKDSGDIIDGVGLTAFTAAEMSELLQIIKPYVPAAALRGVE